MKAKFESYSRDLFWSAFIGKSTLRWSGYNDDYWWNSVAPTDDFQVREHEGKKYRLNPRTNEITPVGDQPAAPTEVPEAAPKMTEAEATALRDPEKILAVGLSLGETCPGVVAPQPTGGTPETNDEFDNEAPTPDTSAFVRELGHYPNLVNGHKQRRKALIKWARRLERQRDEARRHLQHHKEELAFADKAIATLRAENDARLKTIQGMYGLIPTEHKKGNEVTSMQEFIAASRADLEKAKAELAKLDAAQKHTYDLLVAKESQLTAANTQLAEVRERLDKEDRSHGVTINQRDRAEDAANKLASEILGEPIDWSDHEAKWEEAYEEATPAPEVTALRQQLALAREDGERLDWLENQDVVVHETYHCRDDKPVITYIGSGIVANVLRAAIDAARGKGGVT